MNSMNLLKAAVLTSVLSLSVIACSQKAQNTEEIAAAGSSIIGGVQVEAQDTISKSTVAIIASVTTEDGKEGQFICTGSLLSDNVVLTAGHCVPTEKEYKSIALYVIFSRDLNKMERTDVRLVTDALIHPQYGSSTEGADAHDVAVIRFAGAKASGYEIAKFLDDESVLTEGAVVTLAGYGLNKTDGVNTESDNTLRKVNVEVAGNLGKNEIILDQQNGRGACHGDSGGPAFINVAGVEYVWGVTSRGAGKNGVDDCSLASVYTKVKSERTFINAALTQLSVKPGSLSDLDGLDGEGI
ncbi:S1 family peptidase [Bdellovibrio bacteriovorus]|uniref:S1 family peptidase n=1 Tax=Bdellovibrio bacteriovorus TaxID=959 RepID=UPI0009BFDFAB|nr:trypsin-like serine protease [Bdellovibrio bacteriovorus]